MHSDLALIIEKYFNFKSKFLAIIKTFPIAIIAFTVFKFYTIIIAYIIYFYLLQFTIKFEIFLNFTNSVHIASWICQSVHVANFICVHNVHITLLYFFLIFGAKVNLHIVDSALGHPKLANAWCKVIHRHFFFVPNFLSFLSFFFIFDTSSSLFFRFFSLVFF